MYTFWCVISHYWPRLLPSYLLVTIRPVIYNIHTIIIDVGPFQLKNMRQELNQYVTLGILPRKTPQKKVHWLQIRTERRKQFQPIHSRFSEHNEHKLLIRFFPNCVCSCVTVVLKRKRFQMIAENHHYGARSARI